MTVVSVLFLGLLLGLQHATEADHVAAVATLAVRQATPGQALRQGLAWGAGHMLTLLAFGGALFGLGRTLPPEAGRALEGAVGAMLVLLGADVLRRLARPAASLRAPAAAPRAWPLRALAVGMVHGLAGSAALAMLGLTRGASLPLGLATIGVFGLGSLAGMAALSAAIALPLCGAPRRLVRLHAATTAVAGALSCTLGVATAWAAFAPAP